MYDEAYIRKTAQELSSKFNNRAGFLSIINNPIGGMEYSFVQAIASDEELRGELIDAFKAAGVDISDKASAEAVITELRDPSNQNFALVKGIAAQYLAEKGGKIAFDIGARSRPKDETTGAGGMDAFFSPNQNFGSKGAPQINGGTLNTMLMKLQSGRYENINGKNMNLQDDGSWLSDDGSVSMSGDDILNYLYDATFDKFKDDEGGLPVGIFDFRNDYRFNSYRGTKKVEGKDLTPKPPQELALSQVGADGETSLNIDIFDKREGIAGPFFEKVLGPLLKELDIVSVFFLFLFFSMINLNKLLSAHS